MKKWNFLSVIINVVAALLCLFAFYKNTELTVLNHKMIEDNKKLENQNQKRIQELEKHLQN